MEIERKAVLDFGSLRVGGFELELSLTDTVITTWIAMGVVVALSYLLTRRLRVKEPSYRQLLAELLLSAMARQIREFSRMPVAPFFAFIATMWIFVGSSNLIGMVPPLSTPTGDLSAVAGLSTITFFSIFYYGVRFQGLSYFRRYFEPIFILFPLNVVGELGRILSLTFRLFGNMLGWDLIIGILVLLTGLLVPVPMMLFNVLGDVIQAYLFGILTLAYIVAGLEVQEVRKKLSHLEESWYID